MTFKELIKHTYKECDAGVTYNQTRKVLITAVRVAIEELMMHPDTGTIELTTIGKFYMQKRKYRIPYLKGKNNNCAGEIVDRWGVKFRGYPNLTKVVNGFKSIRELAIGGMPLYPDKDISPVNGRKPIKFTTDQTVDFQIKRRAKNAEKKAKKQRNVNITSRLPDED